MRIIVTGAAGRLGGQLTKLLNERGQQVVGVDIVGANVEIVDISDFQAAKNLVNRVKPDLVIHPAAWTDVDGCAHEPEKAIAINGFGTQHMAVAAAAVGAPILYVSSNEVFDGSAARPYREYDATNPINPYGYSKWVGERALLHTNPRHYVVRTSWLFAHGGKNFIQSILNAAQAGKTLRVVVNEVASPTYNDDLAEAILSLIETERFGVYHFVNEGVCSRYQFARYALDRSGFQDKTVIGISSHEWQRASSPPVYGGLANLAGKQIGITLRPWQAAVDAFLEKEGLLRS